ncbi:MAG: hypothetical protein H6817_11535 [Phycisphaerales bacterium]|nr:hypothetical protein [Phycisphaerales bacterium]
MATIIKAHEQDPQLIRRLETVSVSDHLSEAKLMVASARAEATKILREAKNQAKTIHEEASQQGYEAGFRRGYDAGKQAGHEQAYNEVKAEFVADESQTLAALRATIEAYEERKRDLFIAARQDVVRFAARMAERVTRQVGATHPDAAKDNLDAALNMVGKATNLVVHINPADRATIERFAAEYHQQIASAEHVEIVADESIARGGCRVTTEDAEVDATLETQIGRIVELMVPQRENA